MKIKKKNNFCMFNCPYLVMGGNKFYCKKQKIGLRVGEDGILPLRDEDCTYGDIRPVSQG